jgi:hypothetical protein
MNQNPDFKSLGNEKKYPTNFFMYQNPDLKSLRNEKTTTKVIILDFKKNI